MMQYETQSLPRFYRLYSPTDIIYCTLILGVDLVCLSQKISLTIKTMQSNSGTKKVIWASMACLTGIRINSKVKIHKTNTPITFHQDVLRSYIMMMHARIMQIIQGWYDPPVKLNCGPFDDLNLRSVESTYSFSETHILCDKGTPQFSSNKTSKESL